ncbi:hypothetical protein BH09ACT12_BH09ACT12_24320 [soil metagenome]
MSGRPFWVTAMLDLTADQHPAGQAFWSSVTGYDLSAVRGESGEFATLIPGDGDPQLKVQRRCEGPSRLHLDLHVDDPDEAADRAVELGARVVVRHEFGYVVMTSPAGIPFCFVSHPAARRSPPARWGAELSLVDQVCLDVPPSTYDAEWAFWEALTGWEGSPARLPQFRRVRGPDSQPIRFLVQRLDDEGPAGAHLDLAATNRAAEVARHEALGAEVETVADFWTVLRDPGGLRYCVTDRDPTTGAVG